LEPPRIGGWGQKNEKNDHPPNLKPLLIKLQPLVFRLAPPYSPQTPKNGGFKNLLNQTIEVICFPKSKPSQKTSPGWSPQELGVGGKKMLSHITTSSNKSVLFLRFSYFRKIKFLKDEICSNKGICSIFKKQYDTGRKNSLD
jgi:hypothetical protein